MTKTLKEIQAENRKLILEAIHKCDYEKALKKEEGRTCEYLYQTNYGVQRIIGDVKDYGYNRKKDFPDAFLIEIIGQPITLDRLLLVIPNGQIGEQIEIEFNCWFTHSLIIKYHFFGLRKFSWELKKTTLEEQSEETQREINKFLNGVKICQEKTEKRSVESKNIFQKIFR